MGQVIFECLGVSQVQTVPKFISLRFLSVLCVSAVFLLLRGNCGSSQTKHRRDAENAEEAQRKIELPFIFVVRRQGDLVLNKEHKEQSRQKIKSVLRHRRIDVIGPADYSSFQIHQFSCKARTL